MLNLKKFMQKKRKKYRQEDKEYVEFKEIYAKKTQKNQQSKRRIEISN